MDQNTGRKGAGRTDKSWGHDFFSLLLFYETQVLIKRMHEHRFKKRKEKKEKQRLFSFVCMFRYSYNKIFRKICENYCRWLTT